MAGIAGSWAGQGVKGSSRRRRRHRPDKFDVERIDRAVYRLVRRKARPNDGAVDWLLECLAKGYFVGGKSESTDTL